MTFVFTWEVRLSEKNEIAEKGQENWVVYVSMVIDNGFIHRHVQKGIAGFKRIAICAGLKRACVIIGAIGRIS